jgi:uncharacterized protein YggE
MKKLKLFIPTLLFIPSISFAQVKGNAPRSASLNQGQTGYNYNEAVYDLNPAQDYNGNNQSRSMPLGDGSVRADSVFVIESRVMMNVTASSFLVQFHLTQAGETAKNCTETMDARIVAFKGELGQMGISENDIYVDMISFIPLYEYEVTKKLFSKTANEVPSGFELKKNVHIRLKDDRVLDKVLAAAASHEIYDFARFEYFVPDHEAVYDSIRKVALRILKEKTTDFKNTGLVIDPMFHTMEEATYCIFPDERYQSYAAFGSNSIGYQKKGANITVNDVRKPNSYYYDHLPFNRFDQIVNSELLEPQVQFVIVLQSKYTQRRVK